jgi:hypothetical protein
MEKSAFLQARLQNRVFNRCQTRLDLFHLKGILSGWVRWSFVPQCGMILNFELAGKLPAQIQLRT